MRVIHIGELAGLGGLQNWVCSVAEAQARRGYEVELMQAPWVDANTRHSRICLQVFHFRFAIEKIQNFRAREAAVASHPDFGLGKSIARARHQTAQNPDGAHRARRIPTPQRRHRILLRLLIKGEKQTMGK
jgi:hypothetical protein